MAHYPEQRPNESVKAYAAFQAYCELGAQRSTAKVAQTLGKTKTLIDRWSAQYAWQQRVAEYDHAIAEERASDLREARRAEVEALRAHAQEDAALLRGLGRRFAKVLGERLLTLNPDELDAKELAAVVRVLAQSLQTSTDLDAAALGVGDLLRYFDERNDTHTTEPD